MTDDSPPPQRIWHVYQVDEITDPTTRERVRQLYAWLEEQDGAEQRSCTACGRPVKRYSDPHGCPYASPLT